MRFLLRFFATQNQRRAGDEFAPTHACAIPPRQQANGALVTPPSEPAQHWVQIRISNFHGNLNRDEQMNGMV
jgi:hypothetical protein